jgi:hypothetical protein
MRRKMKQGSSDNVRKIECWFSQFNHGSVSTSRSSNQDMQISRIRLSDKTSRLHPRHVVPKPAQAYEPEVPVKVREWIGPALASPGFVLDAQPPAQPHSDVPGESARRRMALNCVDAIDDLAVA